MWNWNGIAGLTLMVVFCLRARAQSQADTTNGEFWPAADFHIQLSDHYRLLGFVESKTWNEEQYTAGIEWPYKRVFMLETYYLRQNCTTCSPAHLNVAGLTLNLYFRNTE